MNEIVTKIVEQLPELIAAGALSILVLVARRAIEGLFTWLEGKAGSEYLRQAAHEAEVGILAVEEEVVKKAREALADGKITTDEWKAIGRTAKEAATLHVLSWARTIPARFQPAITEGANRLVEAVLNRLKIDEAIGKVVKPALPIHDDIASLGNPRPAPESSK